MEKEKKVLLIVEDERPEREILAKSLSLEGFEVLETVDGEEGLRVALEKHPDLILLDIIMPKLDGMTVLRKLRADDWGKDVPIIMLTNLSDADKVKEAFEKGVSDFLVKVNWKLGDITAKIKEKLGMSE